MEVKEYESAVRSCFLNGVDNIWYGGTEGLIGDDPKAMYVSIKEDDDYYLNKCILRNSYFDYKKFETLPLQIDCADYGVYVFWMKSKK
jgi:hypothetical protein